MEAVSKVEYFNGSIRHVLVRRYVRVLFGYVLFKDSMEFVPQQVRVRLGFIIQSLKQNIAAERTLSGDCSLPIETASYIAQHKLRVHAQLKIPASAVTLPYCVPCRLGFSPKSI